MKRAGGIGHWIDNREQEGKSQGFQGVEVRQERQRHEANDAVWRGRGGKKSKYKELLEERE
jgi:hypothetical protein